MNYSINDKTYTTRQLYKGNKLTYSETQEGASKGYFFTVPRKDKSSAVKKRKHYNPPEPVKNFLSIYVAPKFLTDAMDALEQSKTKESQYRENVVKIERIKKDVNAVPNNNKQGLYKYLIVQEFRACRNGFIYYTLPLILSLILIIINVAKYNFIANFFVACFAIFDIVITRKILKSKYGPWFKTLLFLLIVGLNVGIAYVLKLIGGFYEVLSVKFTLKLFLFAFGAYYFGKFYFYFGITYKMDCTADFGNTVIINAGKPRCGKTSDAVHEAKVFSTLKWKQLQYDYFLWLGKVNSEKFVKRATPDEWLEWHEIKQSYSFYIMRPCIPCLWSNIGIQDYKGRLCHKVTIEHLKGIDRLPIYSVVLLDEIGAMLKADAGLNRKGVEKPVDVADMFRLGGHFVKWTVIGCEQDFNNIYIGCRRVVGFNRVIEGQEWVCKPVLIYSILKFIKWLKIDSLDKKIKPRPKESAFLSTFEKFVRSIGFRKISYKFVQNTETGSEMAGQSSDVGHVVIGGSKVRLVPSNLICRYNDRAYKQEYASYFDTEIRGELFESLLIDGRDENSRMYVNSTKSLEEKYKAIYDEIKKTA